MDIFAHTLWANALFHLKYAHQRRMRYLAAFFGVVPDFIGFAPLFIYLLFSGNLFEVRGPSFPVYNWTANFAEQAYNFTHSLVIWAAMFGLVLLIGNVVRYLKNKKDPLRPLFRFWFFWPLLAWPLHILIDFPTHPDFYNTPIFYPLSGFRFTGGVSWGHPTFMAINYSLLVLVYIGIYLYQKKKYGKKSE